MNAARPHPTNAHSHLRTRLRLLVGKVGIRAAGHHLRSERAHGRQRHGRARNYAVDFIRATRWIKENLPHAKVSGGISNVSFVPRQQSRPRSDAHRVSLSRDRAGIDMGIVNAGMLEVYEEIDADLQ